MATRRTSQNNDLVAPMIGSFTSALAQFRRSLFPNGISSDGTVGAAATLGLSLAILRLAVSLYKALKTINEPTVTVGDIGPSVDEDLSDESPKAKVSFFQRILRRVLLGETTRMPTLADRLENENDATIVTHYGSCHCRSVHFELLAPRCLPAKDGPGKIQYRHTQVGAECFRVIQGKKFLQSYYVTTDGTNYQASKSAHAFCGRCGVHILYAPSKNASTVEVNINCLDEDIHKLRVVSKTDTIAEGTPADSQWEESLMTISEDMNSTAGFEFKLQNLYDDTRSTQSMFAKRPHYMSGHHGPATPSTSGSITDSYISSSGAAPTRHIETEAESSSVISGVSNPASTIGRAMSGPLPTPASHRPDPSNITSPQTRDQMLRYMKKHLSTPSARSPHGNAF